MSAGSIPCTLLVVTAVSLLYAAWPGVQSAQSEDLAGVHVAGPQDGEGAFQDAAPPLWVLDLEVMEPRPRPSLQAVRASVRATEAREDNDGPGIISVRRWSRGEDMPGA